MDAAPFDDLLGHARFARGLARALLADEHLAEDVVQETWLAAMRRPPRLLSTTWIGAVARNAALKLRRGESRRAAREAAAARPEEAAAFWRPEQQAILREVVDAVLALDEPFRSTVLLRFYEDVPPREIAARQGVSVNTVNSRLQRALAELRQRLDARRGGRDASASALVVLAGRERTPSPWTSRGTGAAVAARSALVGIKTKAAIATAVVLLVGLATWRWTTDVATSSKDETVSASAESVAKRESESAATRRREERRARDAAPGRSERVTAAEDDRSDQPSVATVEGVAIGPDGVSVLPGFAYVSAETDGERRVIARVDLGAGGTFRMEVAGDVVKDGLDAEVGALASGLPRNAQAVRLRRGATQHVEIRLARGLRIAGTVVRVDGTPVVGLPLLVKSHAFVPRIVTDELLDTDALLAQSFDPSVQWARATTDTAGRFSVDGLAPGGYLFLTSETSWVLRIAEPVAAGTEDARVVARPARTAVLHVKDADTGAPLESMAALCFAHQWGSSSRQSSSTNPALRGELRLRWDRDPMVMLGEDPPAPGAEAGEYSAWLRIESDGHHPRLIPLALDAEGVTILDVEMAPVDDAALGTLRLEVLDSRGEPVAFELEVNLRDSSASQAAPPVRRLSRTAPGRFVLVASPGAWTLTLTPKDAPLGNVALSRDVEMVAGGAADLRVALPPSGVLVVRRRAREGDLPKLLVGATGEGGNSTSTDGDVAEFRWRLAPGAWKVTVGTGDTAEVREVTVGVSEETVVETDQ